MDTYVSFIDDQRTLHAKVPLAEVVGRDFVGYNSIRLIPAHRGQKHLPGLYWFSTLDRLIPYESRLEMFTLMNFDFQGDVIDVLSQPFLLHFADNEVRYRHIPDFLVWRKQGQVDVVDVKPASRVDHAKNRRAFESTEAASLRFGWDFQVHAELDPLYLANLKWLAGYRRRPPHAAAFTEQLVCACAESARSFRELLQLVEPAPLARTVIFHLLWMGILKVDMMQLIGNTSVIYPGLDLVLA